MSSGFNCHMTQVQCLGVRQMKDYKFFSVNRPLVKVQCEEEVASTRSMGKEDVMFPDRNLAIDLVLLFYYNLSAF